MPENFPEWLEAMLLWPINAMKKFPSNFNNRRPDILRGKMGPVERHRSQAMSLQTLKLYFRHEGSMKVCSNYTTQKLNSKNPQEESKL